MNNIILGGFYGLIAQILTFLQLQGNIKYNWYEKHKILLLLFSIPISWLYIQSVRLIVTGFNGQIWPSRIIGFGIGIIVFAIMGYLLFGETINLKTGISLMLAFSILLIQIFMK
jgi:multidrug transporter EmrE-like cation transporter